MKAGSPSAAWAAILVWTASGLVAILLWPSTLHLLGMAGKADSDLNGALVALVFVTVVWIQRHDLASQALHRMPLALLATGGSGLVWLIGTLLFIRPATTLAMVGLLAAAMAYAFGLRWFRLLAFPLALLLLAAPVFSPFVPLLVDATSWFVHLAVRWSGIPVLRDGAYFHLSTGDWSIADSCSGIQYLKTCVLLGALYAWVFFTSARERVAYFLGALLIGVCGNWLRAYLTIAIAHWTGNAWLRESHGTFGWIFYAALFGSYLAIGWRYSARSAVATPSPIDRPPIRSLWWPAVIVAVVTGIWPVMAATLRSTHVVAPLLPVPSFGPAWQHQALTRLDWQPSVNGADTQVAARYGQDVTLYLGVFANAGWDAKLVSSLNQLADPDDPDWTRVSRESRSVAAGGSSLPVESSIVVGRGKSLLAYRWYWIDGEHMAAGTMARFKQLSMIATGRRPAGAWLAVATAADPQAQDRLQRFLSENREALDRTLREYFSAIDSVTP